MSPEGSASWLSLVTQWWVNEMLRRGSAEVLTAQRIWRLDERRMPPVEQAEQLLRERASIVRAMVGVFRREWFLSGLWRLGQLACQAVTPFVLRAFVVFLMARAAGTSHDSAGFGVILAALLGLVPLGEMIFAERAIWTNCWVSYRIRTCLVLLVNRKILRMRRRRRGGPDVGSLVSVDVDRVAESADSLHFLWRTPANVVISLTVLAFMLGVLPALAGLGALLLIVAAAVLCNRKFSRDKRNVVAQTDGRAAATKQLVRNLENVKSVALEGYFREEIEGWRAREVRFLRQYRALYAAFKALTMVLSPLVLFSALATYLLQGKELNAGIVFSSLVAVNQLQMPFQTAVEVVVSLVEARVSLDRIQQFLCEEEDVKRFEAPQDEGGTGSVVLQLKDASFSWHPPKQPKKQAGGETEEDGAELLGSVDEDEEEEDEELVLSGLNLEVRCGQLVWLTGRIGSGKSSLLQAVLGELSLRRGCCRVTPSALFCGQNKDAALVTDSIVENICWGSPFDERVFGVATAGACLTADLAVLVNGAATVVGESGVTLSGGQRARVCLARAIYRALSEPDKPHLLLLDDPLSAVDGQTAHSVLAFIRSLPRNCSVLLSSHHSHLIAPDELVVLLDRGTIADCGVLRDVRNRAGVLGGLFAGQLESPRKGEATAASATEAALVVPSFPAGPAKALHRNENDSRERGHVSLKVYWSFFGTAPRRWLSLSLLFMAHFAVQVMLQLYVATLSSGKGSLGTYALLSLVSSVMMVVKTVLLFVLAIACASSLHSQLLNTITRLTKASVDTTPSGVFITCATSEMDAIDDKMAVGLDVAVRQLLQLGQLMVLGSISTYGVFALVVAGISAAVVALGRWYGKSSIELARSVSICRAPVMSRMVEQEHALTSIRSFGQEEKWREQIAQRLWTLTSCQVMQMAANRWLNLRLSLLGGVGVWILSFLAISGLTTVGTAYVALGVASSMDLRQIFNLTIQKLVTVENSMQACERIRQLGHTLELEDLERGHPLVPTRGAITLDKVCVTYRPGLPQVLTDVSFQAKPGEKLAVCGRTGSGKSTLTRVLLRLVPYDGSVNVDGQDIADVNLTSLRSLIPTITQASLVFSGTLRDTVNPQQTLTEEQIRECMSHVGLDKPLDTPAATLSAGELQLASFCRGIGKVLFEGARVLLLDEASSSIDSISERLVSNLITSPYLRHATIIVIAHRLVSIQSCDRVLVMEKGKIVEEGSPIELNKPGTAFFDLTNAQT